MFTQKQCDRVLDLVLSNRNHWEQRGKHDYGSLFTLGAVSAFGDKERYQRTLKVANPLLQSALLEEYKQIRKWAEVISGCPVQYDQRLALPGFQIFINMKNGGNRKENGGIIHQDYLWKGREISDITGIETVEEEYSATIIFSREQQFLDLWSNYPEGYHTICYERGVPKLHDHQLMHQVPYMGNKGDMRVSMQIRGFKVNNVITLYL